MSAMKHEWPRRVYGTGGWGIDVGTASRRRNPKLRSRCVKETPGTAAAVLGSSRGGRAGETPNPLEGDTSGTGRRSSAASPAWGMHTPAPGQPGSAVALGFGPWLRVIATGSHCGMPRRFGAPLRVAVAAATSQQLRPGSVESGDPSAAADWRARIPTRFIASKTSRDVARRSADLEVASRSWNPYLGRCFLLLVPAPPVRNVSRRRARSGTRGELRPGERFHPR